MSKKSLTHQEIEEIIHDYMQVYRIVYGKAMADSKALIYRKGWFYFCDKKQDKANPNHIVGVPYRAKEIQDMTMRLGKRVPQRPDSDEDYPD